MKTLEWSSEIERLYRNIATSNLILQLELLNATWLNLTQHRRGVPARKTKRIVEY